MSYEYSIIYVKCKVYEIFDSFICELSLTLNIDKFIHRTCWSIRYLTKDIRSTVKVASSNHKGNEAKFKRQKILNESFGHPLTF